MTVDTTSCVPTDDPEGTICANEGTPAVAFCSYGVAPTACAYCSDGAQAAGDVKDKVSISTATSLGFVGGAKAFDTPSNRAAFKSAIIETMAASPNALVVSVTILNISDAAPDRRLLEAASRQQEYLNQPLESVAPMKPKPPFFLATTFELHAGWTASVGHYRRLQAVNQTANATSTTNATAAVASTPTATQIQISYTIDIPLDDNAHVEGGADSVQAASIADFDAAASSTSGAVSFAAALAQPAKLGSSATYTGRG